MRAGQVPELSNKKHEAFAVRYVQTRNAAEVAREFDFAPEYGRRLTLTPHVAARIQELTTTMLERHHITADRVMLELARIGFGDMRKAFDERGELKPVHELDDDAAAIISGVEVEVRNERDGFEEDLATGEMKPKFVSVRTSKIKRFNKDASLTTLAKHFKLIGDEGDGLNAIASALAGRLKDARKRVELVQEVPKEIEG